jgi:hypothetical protein
MVFVVMAIKEYASARETDYPNLAVKLYFSPWAIKAHGTARTILFASLASFLVSFAVRNLPASRSETLLEWARTIKVPHSLFEFKRGR